MTNITTDTRKDALLWWKEIGAERNIELMAEHFGYECDIVSIEQIETIYKAEHPPLPTTVENKEVDLLEWEAMEYIKKIDKEIGPMWTEDDEDISKHFAIFSQQQNKRLREVNTVLLEALNGLMEGNEQDPNNPLRWWQRITPKQDALNKALTAIEQANNSLTNKQG